MVALLAQFTSPTPRSYPDWAHVLVTMSLSLSSYLYLPCWVWKAFVSLNSSTTSVSYNFSNISFKWIPETRREGCNTDIPFRDEHPKVCYSLPINQLSISVLIAFIVRRNSSVESWKEHWPMSSASSHQESFYMDRPLGLGGKLLILFC